MSYINHQRIYNLVLDSWTNSRDYKESLERNRDFIYSFRLVLADISNSLSSNYIFILTDPELLLLDFLTNKNTGNNFKKGIIFSKEKVGTNAIQLASEIKEPVYLAPDQHYCSIFNEYYCFATPLILNNNLIGILNVSANHKLINEIIITTQLASELILNKLNAIKKEMNISSLTDKQISILYLIAKGFTERAIAVEIGISLNTVRYHKKKTFKILGVNNNCEAIIKAIKLNIIDVNNIHL